MPTDFIFSDKINKDLMVLNWKAPEITDRDWVVPLVPKNGRDGCDSSFAAMFLWQKMCCMQIAGYENFLLRRMNCVKERKGYGFPIGSGNLREVINILSEEAIQRCGILHLYSVSETSRNELESLFPGQFEFSFSPDDSDYIYVRSSLAELPGRKYHKIRNHIAQFNRKYPDAEFRRMEKSNLADAAEVERLWLEEHKDIIDRVQVEMQDYEHLAFTDALTYFEELQLRGVILYCGGQPAAVSIASKINDDICDVNFEKAVKPYSDFGAFAALRNHLASTLDNFRWFNLEEDMGLPGLRKSKQAWHPAVSFLKYTAVKKS